MCEMKLKNKRSKEKIMVDAREDKGERNVWLRKKRSKINKNKRL